MIWKSLIGLICAALLFSGCSPQSVDEQQMQSSQAFISDNGTGSDFANEATPSTTDSLEVAIASTGALIIKVESGSVRTGNAKAPVLRIYTDFNCIYCRQFAIGDLAELEHGKVNEGKVQIEEVFVPMSDVGTTMARIAFCAVQKGKYADAKRLLMSLPAATGTNTAGMAKQLGLDAKWLTQCMTSDKTTQMLAGHEAKAKDAGVTRVPTFTLGQTTWLGLLPHDEFMRKVDEFIGR